MPMNDEPQLLYKYKETNWKGNANLLWKSGISLTWMHNKDVIKSENLPMISKNATNVESIGLMFILKKHKN